MNERDDTAVRAVLDQVYAAFAANDADAYVTAYADTVSCVMPGAYLPDRAALHTAMRQLFAGPLAGARGTYDLQSIRFLGSEVAVVISRGVVLLANQTDPAAADPWMDTWVLSRDGDSWRVASFHSCPAQTGSPSS
jgi:uncharacterized protein (TIGR02246 family)